MKFNITETAKQKMSEYAGKDKPIKIKITGYT